MSTEDEDRIYAGVLVAMERLKQGDLEEARRELNFVLLVLEGRTA